MKIKVTNKENPNFKPITLELTFETAAEAEMFYSIFNYVPVCEAMRPVLNPCELRYAIEDIPGSPIRYQNHFDAFQERVEKKIKEIGEVKF